MAERSERDRNEWYSKTELQKNLRYALGIGYYLGFVAICAAVYVFPLAGLIWGLVWIVGGVAEMRRGKL